VEILKFEQLMELIERLEDLPTLPSIAQELTKMIADPLSSTSQVEHLMENDLSLTVKVLRLVNSAYYAIPGGVKTLGRAIGYLGFDTVHQLVLSATIFSALENVKCDGFNLTEFWKHSIGTAMAAETIAKMTKQKNPTDLFTCGLIHDLGKLVYIVVDREGFMELLEHSAKQRVSFVESETQLKRTSHVDLGFALAQKWNLPVTMQNSIRYHHQKDAARRPSMTPDSQAYVDIVLLANLFIHGLNFGNSGHTQIESAPKVIFDRLGLNSKLLPQISREISKTLANSDAFLKVLSSTSTKDTTSAA
jgi:putative nucleotidyltransferase with HDIG domain